MGRYRIKKEGNSFPDGLAVVHDPPEPYWRETSPEQARDLDFDEIAALNHAAEEEEAAGAAGEEPIPISPFRSPWVKAVLALAVIVAFLVWVSADLFSGIIDFSFVKRSAQLAQDEALTALRQAVVTVESSSGSGSGFNIRADGLIVTNLHVVDTAGIITVTTADGNVYTSRTYLPVDGVDLALIDIDGADLPTVELSASYPDAGDSLIFIGNPLGIDWTISEATARGMVTVDDITQDTPMIWFDGPVQPGYSGSPLFNSQSEVIGVVFAKLTEVENSGLAIPISYLISFLEEQL